MQVLSEDGQNVKALFRRGQVRRSLHAPSLPLSELVAPTCSAKETHLLERGIARLAQIHGMEQSLNCQALYRMPHPQSLPVVEVLLMPLQQDHPPSLSSRHLS
jgi:hypothetical protein